MLRVLARLGASFLITSVAAVMVVASPSAAAGDTTGSISGTITGPAGAALAPNAFSYVTAYDGDDYAGSTYVAQDGSYTLENLQTGSYSVSVTSQAVYQDEYYLNASDRQSATPVTVTGGQTTLDIDIELNLGATITGKLSGPAGVALDPSASIYVTAYDDDGSYVRTAYVDTTSGMYSVGGLATGAYRLEFRDQNVYLKEYYSNKATLDTATTVNVVAGQIKANINESLAVGGAITGTVTGPGGASLSEDASPFVNVLDLSGNQVDTAGASVSENGTFRLGGLKSGQYIVAFSDWSGTYMRAYSGGSATFAGATPVTVVAGAVTPNIDAELGLGASLSGRITGPNGTVLSEGAQLFASLMTPDGNYVDGSYSSVQPDGSYRFGGLAAGQYVVVVYDASGTYTATYSGESLTLEDASAVPLEPGSMVSDHNISMNVGGSITGKITGPGGSPIDPDSSIEVWIYDPEEELSDGIHSEVLADGTYLLRGLATGSYKVSFRDQAGIYSRVYSGGATSPASAEEIQVTRGMTTSGVDVSMTIGGAITGVVAGPNAAPIQSDAEDGVYVTAYDSNGDWAASGSLRSDGTYRVGGLATGDYRLKFEDDAGKYATEYYRDRPNLASATAVAVVEGATTAGVDATLAPGGHISGTVTAGNGTPLALDGAITVTAFDGNGIEVASTQIWDDEGSRGFGFWALPVGEYRLKFTDESGTYATEYYSNKTTLATATPVAVTADTDSEVTVQLDKKTVASAPSAVTAVPGNGAANVSWTAPTSDGGWPVTGYTVTSFPGGQTCTTTGATTCQVAGLFNGTSYQFTVKATNALGSSAESAPSVGVTPTAPVTPTPTPIPVVPAPAPVAPSPARSQALVKAPTSVKRKKSKALTARTGAGIGTRWTSSTPKVCKIKGNKVVAGNKKGTCKLTVVAAGNATWLPLRQTFRVKIS